MKTVFLDESTVTLDDVSFQPFKDLGDYVGHVNSTEDGIVERAKGAAMIANKVPMTHKVIASLPDLKISAFAAALMLACVLPMATVKAAPDAGIMLREFGPVSGRVLDDATGKPVRSFNVRMAHSKTGGFSPGISVRMMQQGLDCSHPDGQFKLRKENLDPKNAYRLIVSAQGYEWAEVDDVHSGTPVEVRLKKATPVIVHVTDGDGKGVDNAIVRFYYCYRTKVHSFQSRTSPQNLENAAFAPIESKPLGGGQYEFSGVSAGPWALEVLDKGHVRHAELFPDGATKIVAVKLESGHDIAGILMPPRGMRPEQFKIAFDAHGNPIEAQPDAQGRFKLRQASLGRARIEVRAHDNSMDAAWPLNLRSLAEKNLVLDFSEFFLLEGRVTAEGKNVAGAHVYAYCRHDTDLFRASATSGPDGRYRLFLPRKGKYSVSASSTAGKVKLDIKIDRKTTSRDLELITGRITGILLDESRAPVASALVSALRLGERTPAYFHERWKEEAYEDFVRVDFEPVDRQGRFRIVGLLPGQYRIAAANRDYTRTSFTNIITLKNEGDRIDNIRLSMGELGGVDVKAVDAETGKILTDTIDTRIRCFAHVFGRSKPGESVCKLGMTRPGTYDLWVGAPGYQSTIIPAVEIEADKRRTITAHLKQGGTLAVTLKTVSSQRMKHPTLLIVLRNIPEGKIALREILSQNRSNVASLSIAGKGNELKATLMPGIAPGDYDATLYYRDAGWAANEPVGQFNISFHIDVGKITQIQLNEADMQPYVQQ